MKTIKITFLSLVAACTMASCDFLEKEPYKITPENYFQNETEVSNFLMQIYRRPLFMVMITWFLQAVTTWNFMAGLPDVFLIQV